MSHLTADVRHRRSHSQRFASSPTLVDGDKPDSKSLSGLGSPVTPLRTRPAASSSSSSSAGSVGKIQNRSRRSDPSKAHSGELSGSSDSSPNANPSPTHRRSVSGQSIYSANISSSTASSSAAATNVLPAGNICPSGMIGKTSIAARPATRTDVLRSGTGNYGHGSIMRGGIGNLSNGKLSSSSSGGVKDPHEVTKLGNECYKKGNFTEALRFYDRAVEICPGNAACRSNRAASLTGLGRLGEAVKECEEAVRLDSMYGRAHHRLATLYLR